MRCGEEGGDWVTPYCQTRERAWSFDDLKNPNEGKGSILKHVGQAEP